MEWLAIALALVVIVLLVALYRSETQSAPAPDSTERWNQLMATLAELQEASAELGTKIDALIAAVRDVRETLDQALALDAETDAAERDVLLNDTRAKTAKIEEALSPESPVEPEDLPPS